MYPLVPHPSHYKYSLGHVYQGRGVKVGKGSVLEECVLLGRGCVARPSVALQLRSASCTSSVLSSSASAAVANLPLPPLV